MAIPRLEGTAPASLSRSQVCPWLPGLSRDRVTDTLLNPGTYLILFTADGVPLLVIKAYAVAFGTSFSFFFFPATIETFSCREDIKKN